MILEIFEPWPDCPLDGNLKDYKESEHEGKHAHLVFDDHLGPGWCHHAHEDGDISHLHEDKTLTIIF